MFPTATGISAPAKGQYSAQVGLNARLCRDHYRLELRLKAFPATHPGQFVQLACRDLQTVYTPERELDWTPDIPARLLGRELSEPLAFLRRPFSLAGRRDVDGEVWLEIIYRVVGTGTSWLAKLEPGQAVQIIGPLGNHFEPPPPGGRAILVGGGVGIPPMLYLASTLGGRSGVAFCGATTRDLLPLTATGEPADNVTHPAMAIEEFARHGVAAVVTTDDGSMGFHGLVTDALGRYLDTLTDLKKTVIYTCGPEPMMKRVAGIAAERGMECQVSVERAMACGMGTCQSCCIRVRKPDPSQPPLAGNEWAWRLACTDGPVFRGVDLMW